MTRAHAMKELLNHGALTRKELLEITGWTPEKVRYTLSYLSEKHLIVKKQGKWYLL